MNTERLLAYYERIADAPDAIARMRRFVHDLAVRGKLVPQDPRDEPVVKLLSRVAAETARLIKKGESKQKGTTSQLAQDEMWPVPASWAFIPLELLATPTGLFTDGDWVESKDQDPDGSVRLTQLADVGTGDYRNRSSRFMNAATAARLNCTFLTPGDILIARMPDPLGRACIFPGDPKPCVTVVDVAVLRLGNPDFVASYVVLAINCPQFARNVGAKAAGTTRSRISRGNLSLIPFPLPPVAEQHRIVAKVNELMALCDRLEEARVGREKTRDRLVASSLACLNAPDPETFQDDARFVLAALPSLTTRADQIKQFRQTILNLAVRGKLLPQDPRDEPASELLKRIAKERMRLVNAGEVKKTQKLPPPIDTETPFTLPHAWLWARFVEVAAIQSNLVDPRGYKSYPHIAPDNIESGTGRLLSYDTIGNSGVFSSKHLFEAGCLLYSKIRPALSKVTFADFEGLCSADMYPLRPFVDRNYLHKFMLAEAFVRQSVIEDNRVAMPKINQESLSKILVAVPPLAEQHRIAAKVDELMTLCDRLEASLTTGDDTRRRLLDALLAEALAPAKGTAMEAVA